MAWDFHPVTGLDGGEDGLIGDLIIVTIPDGKPVIEF
jgi:hypothetical protein